MLPEDFAWAKALSHDAIATRLQCRGTEVASLLARLDGTWFARLDSHCGVVRTLMVFRDCTSFESGKAGIELWATRHQGRIRREVAEREAERPRHLGTGS